jgi:hypothetical protein
VAFVVGALIGGRLLHGPQKMRERRVDFAVEWLIIVAATLVAALTHPDAHNFSGQAVVALLSLAMGLQNAMVRTHGVPDLATNVMTVTFTAIFADSTPAGGDNRNWRRRVLSIGLFVTSAAIGALLLQFGLVWPLVLASIVFTAAMVPLLFGDHQSKEMPDAAASGQPSHPAAGLPWTAPENAHRLSLPAGRSARWLRPIPPWTNQPQPGRHAGRCVLARKGVALQCRLSG